MKIRRKCPYCSFETLSELKFDDYYGVPFYVCNVCGVTTVDKDWFVTVLNESRLMQIIKNQKPQGLFLYDTGIEIIGVANTPGGSYTEEFPDKLECMMWLAEMNQVNE